MKCLYIQIYIYICMLERYKERKRTEKKNTTHQITDTSIYFYKMNGWFILTHAIFRILFSFEQ